MALQIPRLTTRPISLTFHLSCWQNRRARIYVDGMTLDQFPDTFDVGSFVKHLVLSGKDHMPLPLDEVGGRETLFFNHDEISPNVLELQVWHVENGKRCLFEEFGNRSDTDPSLRLERISTAKNRFYITLDCDKRLKVQRLVLVAILRANGEIFVSEDAHFPPPSSKRGAPPRLKGRTGPYETLLSFSDMAADDDLRHSPRSPRQPSSPPTSGRRRASSVRSTSSAASSPRSGSSAEVNSWQTLVKWLLESRHSDLPSALLLQHLAQLSSIAIDFGTLSNTNSPTTTPRAPITTDSLREELIGWLETGPYHIMELLEAGILQQCIMEPWFLGNISEGAAHSYLHWYCQRANISNAFLVRFSSPNFPHIHPITYPHLVIDAIWTNEQTNTLERYSAPVLYDFDGSSQLYFWIETANDAGPSRSSALSDVVRYICNTTGWSHVWRNPPPTPAYLSPQPHAASPSALFSPRSPLSLALTASSDAIGHQKHRSMPLLHTSPSGRLRSTSVHGTSSQAIQGYSSPGPSRSPLLSIPSKIGLLPHDPATQLESPRPVEELSSGSVLPSHTAPTSAGSSFSVWTAATAHSGAFNNDSLSLDPVSHFDMNTTPSNTLQYEPEAHMDPSEATSDTSSLMDADSSFHFHTQHQHLPVQASGFVGHPNDNSLSNNGVSSFPQYEPAGYLSQAPVSDSIGGARSLSAPSASKTWSLGNGALNGGHLNYDQGFHDNPSPAPFYMTSQPFPYASVRTWTSAHPQHTSDMANTGLISSDPNRLSFKPEGNQFNPHVPHNAFDLSEASQ